MIALVLVKLVIGMTNVQNVKEDSTQTAQQYLDMISAYFHVITSKEIPLIMINYK